MSERVLMFQVYGTPRPKPSVRGVGGHFTVRTKRDANLWRDAVTRVARAAADTLMRGGHDLSWLADAVTVDREYRFTPPARSMRRLGQVHSLKPDADNLDKLLFDAMQDAGVLPGGDQRVSGGLPRKLWARQAGVWVIMRPDTYQAHDLESLRGEKLFG